MRNASRALGQPTTNAVDAAPVAATLLDGLVISTKDDLALVVINIGRRQGVQRGMPFEVLRDRRVVGTGRVVDVREHISGAVIQDLNSGQDPIKVSDHLRVAARP
jgi:hypothetical protein